MGLTQKIKTLILHPGKVFCLMLPGVICVSPAWGLPCQYVFLKDIPSLGKAMTEGLHLRHGQEEVFQFYGHQFFPSPSKGPLYQEKFTDVLDTLESYPELRRKLPVRDQIIKIKAKTLKPESVTRFIKSFQSSAGRVKNNLLNISANVGFWMRILHFPEFRVDKTLSKEEQKKLKTAHKKNFLKYLNQFIDQIHIKFIENVENDYTARVMTLYELLDNSRSILRERGYDTSDILQAMVNLISIAGFGDTANVELLRSQDVDKNMEGVFKILLQRDVVSSKLGFDDFSHLKQSLLVYPTPQLALPAQDLNSTIFGLEKDIQNQSYTVKETYKSLTVRALSVQESPFRGCLGGDCSSNLSFLKALDPDFLYFTLTDKEYKSSGHVTVVLGEASQEQTQKKVKVAFVDKIQNIPTLFLKPMLSAIHFGLKEHGYLLVFAENKEGEREDLSNSGIIRDYVAQDILTHLKNRFLYFKPHHKGRYRFHDSLSRAYQVLAVKEFEPFYSNRVEIIPGELHSVNFLKQNFNIKELFHDSIGLMDSYKESDHLVFLKMLKTSALLMYMGINKNEKLKSMVGDKKFSFKVRKQAFFDWMEENHTRLKQSDFESLWSRFSLKEQKVLRGEMSNWKDVNLRARQRVVFRISNMFFDREGVFKELEWEWVKWIVNLLGGYQTMVNAVTFGTVDLVKLLIQQGVDIHQTDQEGYTVVHRMALNITALNEVQLTDKLTYTRIRDNIKVLIEHGLDIEKKVLGRHTALQMAVYSNHSPLARLLQEVGAEPTALKLDQKYSHVKRRKLKTLFKH